MSGDVDTELLRHGRRSRTDPSVASERPSHEDLSRASAPFGAREALRGYGRSAALSRRSVINLGQALGNQAVQRIVGVAGVHPTTGKGPSSEEEGVVVAGKAGAPSSALTIHRKAIASFQRQNPRAGIAARQRALLGPSPSSLAVTSDQSSMLRRKGKGAAVPTASPVVGHKTVKGPTSFENGGFSWTVQWELDKPSPKGGWIVQHVESATNVTNKDGAKVPGAYAGLHPLWEAWQVNKGQSVTTYAETGDVDDDTYGHPSIGESKGTVDVIGSAVFYEGLKLPKSFKVTNQAPAWILPMTKSDPGLKGGSTALAHNINATWDGIDGDGQTKLTPV